MSSSNKRPNTKAGNSVGQELKAARLEQNLSLKQVELTTKVRGKYLLAIESDDYDSLPHDVYTRGFVQSYAEQLGLNGPDLAGRFINERGERPVQLGRPSGQIATGSSLSSRTITLTAIALVLVVVVGYLFWQFSALTRPPKLTVSSPDHDQVLYGSLITIHGNVGSGADVYVNDSPILSDASGRFSDAIALQDGVNAIRVSAKNRLGKTTVVTRNILAHVPKTDPAFSLPTAPFPGVAASVQIKDATAAVKVSADGKDIFHGTMLPGTVQTFKATGKLTISTSNAGATELTITNSTVAGKSLGTIGPLGKPKDDLEFAADTQFQ